jgi:hypothetical protein
MKNREEDFMTIYILFIFKNYREYNSSKWNKCSWITLAVHVEIIVFYAGE